MTDNLGIGAVVAALIGALATGLAKIVQDHRARRFEIKRDACLEALAVVDAVFSHWQWHQQDGQKLVAKQPVDIAAARRCHHKLALSCQDPAIVEKYLVALGLIKQTPPLPPAQALAELRSAIRKDLGFGKEIPHHPEAEWIGCLAGTKEAMQAGRKTQ